MWHTGTQISDVILDIETAGVHTVKGFATIDDVALINVEVSSITITLPFLCFSTKFFLYTKCIKNARGYSNKCLKSKLS